ncbi:oogenesin-3-like [Grammomys surdaster]|uniref:oogenesin-3-like n=1 Tax=Grammomys surdaster TaxID=491861 RepID=UPI00109FF804|nr:oogenesin-3-like [Grammomys surdaster]
MGVLDEHHFRQKNITMSGTPSTLFQLARHSLLTEEALVISALEQLPIHLFSTLFKGGFTDRHTKVLTAVVSAWPFPYLPVGALIDNLDLETLKALLDGLNVLLTKKVHSSRCKLRMLDLRRNVKYNFNSIQVGSHEDNGSPQTCPHPRRRLYFKVVTDFELTEAGLDEWIIYLLQWVKQRKSSVHLCCRKLHSCALPVSTVRKVLKLVDLNCILELRLSQWLLEFLVDLVPYLEQMSNLQTLVLEGIQEPFSATTCEDQEDEWHSTLLSMLPNFVRLQNLCLNDIYLLEDSLDKWLSCLTTPLETLSIIGCHRLLQSDFEYLPHCVNIRKLKHLNLNGIFLCDILPKLPGLILENVSSTLQILELEQCGMTDSHFKALLPALSKCSRLLKVNFYKNDHISLLVLKDLLCHTAKLSQLTEELYPAPLECYEGNKILKDKFKQFCPELLDLLRALRKPKKVSFATRSCWECSHSCYYSNLGATDCLCH